MKKLDKLILKSFLGPLVLTFAIAEFVLLMQFVWKYVDDMVGKGLDFSVIGELMFHASATFVPMALPIAVLFASIMTMGNFGEKYELVAMKAGGVSLNRMMMPMVAVVAVLTIASFYFANYVLPTATLKSQQTLYDVTRKKPALNIRPSEYYSEIDGYVIRIDEKDPEGNMLQGITIYDHTKGNYHNNVVVAKTGTMQMSPDERYLIFTLNDGYSYSEDMEGEAYTSRPLTRIGFKEQTMTFDISSFAYGKSEAEFFKGSFKMLNIHQLDTTIRLLENKLDDRKKSYFNSMVDGMTAWKSLKSETFVADTDTIARRSWEGLASLDKSTQKRVIQQAKSVAQRESENTRTYTMIIASDSEYINRHYIEWHRKFTLSVACLVMFLIGAPFGSIVRKGGLGMPLVASVVFFVIYYVVGMIAEKAVREGALGPWGMWVSTLVLLPVGIALTLWATSDGQFLTFLRNHKKNRR